MLRFSHAFFVLGLCGITAPVPAGQEGLEMASESFGQRQSSTLSASGEMSSSAFATTYQIGLPASSVVMASDNFAIITGVPDPTPTDRLFKTSFEAGSQ